jgi:hypothetical protein
MRSQQTEDTFEHTSTLYEQLLLHMGPSEVIDAGPDMFRKMRMQAQTWRGLGVGKLLEIDLVG